MVTAAIASVQAVSAAGNPAASALPTAAHTEVALSIAGCTVARAASACCCALEQRLLRGGDVGITRSALGRDRLDVGEVDHGGRVLALGLVGGGDRPGGAGWIGAGPDRLTVEGALEGQLGLVEGRLLLAERALEACAAQLGEGGADGDAVADTDFDGLDGAGDGERHRGLGDGLDRGDGLEHLVDRAGRRGGGAVVARSWLWPLAATAIAMTASRATTPAAASRRTEVGVSVEEGRQGHVIHSGGRRWGRGGRRVTRGTRRRARRCRWP